jgi:hypothetical protein
MLIHNWVMLRHSLDEPGYSWGELKHRRVNIIALKDHFMDNIVD